MIGSKVETWLDQAVLVYGPRKAGTTLLQSLLDGGPTLLMLPGELKLKYMQDLDRRGGRERLERYFSHGRSIFRANGVHWRNEKQAIEVTEGERFRVGSLELSQFSHVFSLHLYLEDLAERFAAPTTSFRETILGDIQAFAKALKNEVDKYEGWACKEVGGDAQAAVALFKGLFPAARFIFIARNPLFVVRSIILDRRRRGNALSAREIAWHWRDTIQVLDFLASQVEVSPANGIVVLYEDLVHSTANEMRRILRWLGIPFGQIYTTPTTLGIEAKVKTSSRRTTQVFTTSTQSWSAGLTVREAGVLSACMAAHTVGSGRSGGFQGYQTFSSSVQAMRATGSEELQYPMPESEAPT